jgi:hypothetical protein
MYATWYIHKGAKENEVRPLIKKEGFLWIKMKFLFNFPF